MVITAPSPYTILEFHQPVYKDIQVSALHFDDQKLSSK